MKAEERTTVNYVAQGIQASLMMQEMHETVLKVFSKDHVINQTGPDTFDIIEKPKEKD